jgi:hypothetical protein
MNIVQLQKAFELMSDQELSQQQEHGFLRDTEVKRRVELRNSYQQAQQQADASKTVSEKGIEELMMGGVAGADPMAGQGGDPSMQAGVAAGVGGPQGPPMPSMMYGGGMLGFDGGGMVDHDHPHEDTGGNIFESRSLVPESDVMSGVTKLLDEGLTPEQAAERAEARRLQEVLKETGKDFTSPEAYIEAWKDRQGSLSLKGSYSVFPTPEEWLSQGQTKASYFDLAARQGPDRVAQAEAYDWDTLLKDTPSLVITAADKEKENLGGMTDEVLALGKDEGMTRGGEEGVNEEEGVNKELQDYLDSLSPQRDYLSEADAIVAKTLGKIQDPELYAELFAQQSDAAKAQLDRAKGIRSLRDSRAEDQRRLLADSLGLSDERIRELQGLADTPEEIASRRKAGALKDLSYMFMADPTKLPENLKEVTEGITTLDDTLKQETRDAAKEMYAARRARQTAEEVGTSGIFDTEEKSLMGMDTSQSAFDQVHADIAKAKADQSISGEMAAMQALVGLRKAQAAQQAVNQKARQDMVNQQAARDNPLTPENWERYQMMKDDLRNDDFSAWIQPGMTDADVERTIKTKRAELAETIRIMDAAYMAQVRQAGRLILSDNTERKLPVSSTQTTTTTAQS